MRNYPMNKNGLQLQPGQRVVMLDLVTDSHEVTLGQNAFKYRQVVQIGRPRLDSSPYNITWLLEMFEAARAAGQKVLLTFGAVNNNRENGNLLPPSSTDWERDVEVEGQTYTLNVDSAVTMPWSMDHVDRSRAQARGQRRPQGIGLLQLHLGQIQAEILAQAVLLRAYRLRPLIGRLVREAGLQHLPHSPHHEPGEHSVRAIIP